jgi:hypothetical protein
MNNLHHWDQFFRENFSLFKSKLIHVELKKELDSLQETSKSWGLSYSVCIGRMIAENKTDPNIGYNIPLLVAQTWAQLRGDKEKEETMKGQLEDMIGSSGFCEQGWSNRMLQILSTL